MRQIRANSRAISTLQTFDQLIDIVTKPDLFENHFKIPLMQAYPLGREEAKHFLTRVRDIRNDVSHGRGCSARRLEQVICYSNDLIDSLKMHFGQINMQKAFNVPSIIRFSDSLGNTSYLDSVSESIPRFIDWRQQERGDLYPGDKIVAEVEVDPSFGPSEYDVTWEVFGQEGGLGTIARIAIQNQHVGEQFELRFWIISKRDWHRYYGRDDGLVLIYRVLPPVA
jgi:hypothetical protein